MYNDNRLLELLVRQGLLTAKQRSLVELKKRQVRQELLRRREQRKGGQGKEGADISQGAPDLIDVILALRLEHAQTGRPLTEEDLFQAIARESGLPFVKLDPLDLDIEIVTKTLPRSFALRHLILPFKVADGVLSVAVCDPDSREVLEEVERASQRPIRPHITSRSDIRKLLGEFHGFQSSISAAESHLGGPAVDIANLEQYVRIASSDEAAMSDRHIQRAVDHLFAYAFEQRASDIHLEPKREHCLVRLRIDGRLHTVYSLPKVVHPAIVSRIKAMSRLNIAEKRRPQDGRIKVDRDGKQSEIRVSTVPVAFGEKVVLRILDPDVLFRDLGDLGFSERDLRVFRSLIAKPYGIFLVTGPTGSGKSTTLYSTLKQVARPELNIVTVEDPVEMVCEEFNQISVQPQVDVTFSSILRNILRQDPDIIMIGEVRDGETAAHAVQAALTGHLVFSTLHTNDAVSAITRLLDLGVQPFLIASTLIGAMAQRLVRMIDRRCKVSRPTPAQTITGFGFPADQDMVLYEGKGCRECRQTGYFGRCGIFEIFAVSDKLQSLISAGASEAELRAAAQAEGMTTLRQDAWRKVAAGVTTLGEAVRIVGTAG